MNNDYNKQAADFLLSCNVLFKAEKAVPQLAPRWAKDGKHGTQYSVTLSKFAEPLRYDAVEKFIRIIGKPEKVIQFFFWNSINKREEAEHGGSDKPKPYDVLAGLYMSVDGFADFCANFGYSEDSKEAEATFHEVEALNKKLESIFTPSELEKLQEIQ